MDPVKEDINIMGLTMEVDLHVGMDIQKDTGRGVGLIGQESHILDKERSPNSK